MDFIKHKATPVVLLGIIALVFSALLYLLTSPLQTVPSCLYGCDLPFEQGVVIDLLSHPGNTWQSSAHSYLNIPHSTPKGYYYVRMGLAKLAGLPAQESWKAAIYASYLFLCIGLLGWFLFFKKIFKEPYLAILLSVFMFPLGTLPFFKYSSILHAITPFILLCMLLVYERSTSPKHVLLPGLGLLALFVLYAHIHTVSFFVMYALFGVGALFFLKKKEQWITVGLIGLAALAVILATGWWTQALFVHGGANNALKFDIHPDLANSAVFWKAIPDYARSLLFSFTGPLQIGITLLSLAGLILLAFTKRTKTEQYLFWIGASVLICTFHFIITVPLLGKFFSARHVVGLYGPLLSAMLIGYALTHARKRFKTATLIIVMAGIVLLSILSAKTLLKQQQDSFFTIGYSPTQEPYASLRNYFAEQHIDPTETIILSTNELSFAVNAVTGSKLITGRQSHYFLFGDFQQVWMDAAIMLYGHNEETRQSLINQYKSYGMPLYLYWDVNWISTEYILNEQGQLLGYFDPLRFEYTPERAAVLDQEGIQYVIQQGIFEPSNQMNPDAKVLTILYLSPANYVDFSHPWHDGLNSHLEPVWSYTQNGQALAVLYRIN